MRAEDSGSLVGILGSAAAYGIVGHRRAFRIAAHTSWGPGMAADAKVQDVSSPSPLDTRVKALVVDTNALIKRVRLDELAQQLYTVPNVLVRAAGAARGSWRSLRSCAPVTWLTCSRLPVADRSRSGMTARQIWSST
jgi:hypothetical protein